MKEFSKTSRFLVFSLLLLITGCKDDVAPDLEPSLGISAATDIGETTATLNGTVNNDGGDAITERGFYWATDSKPDSGDTKVSVNGTTGKMTCILSKLEANTTYYYAAFATNGIGTATDTVRSFTTLSQKAALVTNEATDIDETAATLNGTVNNDGGDAITERGFYWATHNNPSSDDTKVSVSGTTGSMNYVLSNLQAITTYYYVAYATNSRGTSTGDVQSFITLAKIPSLSTDAATDIDETTVTLNGEVSDDGGSAITERGFYWATHNNPNSDDTKVSVSGTTGSMTHALSGLTASTTYYYVAYATNNRGTSMGDEQSFTTTGNSGGGDTGSMTDSEGNTYKTVKIGAQWWMAENLKATKYADGTAIPHVTDNSAWGVLNDNNSDKAYCFYDNDASSDYGVLYTFAAAINGTPQSGSNKVQGVCPDGWHLPSNGEWKELEEYMIANGYNYNGSTNINMIGKALASKTGWASDNKSGRVGNNPSTNNSSGFSALPGGVRTNNGAFNYAGNYGFWWSSNVYDTSKANFRLLNYEQPSFVEYRFNKSFGFSVRCLKD